MYEELFSPSGDAISGLVDSRYRFRSQRGWRETFAPLLLRAGQSLYGRGLWNAVPR